MGRPCPHELLSLLAAWGRSVLGEDLGRQEEKQRDVCGLKNEGEGTRDSRETGPAEG